MTDEGFRAWANALLDADVTVTMNRLRNLESDTARIVEASDGSNADDEHDPEGATIAFERAQTSALATSATKHLGELRDAFDRLRNGTYGDCERCGQRIPIERLEVLPCARTCVSHAKS